MLDTQHAVINFLDRVLPTLENYDAMTWKPGDPTL